MIKLSLLWIFYTPKLLTLPMRSREEERMDMWDWWGVWVKSRSWQLYLFEDHDPRTEVSKHLQQEWNLKKRKTKEPSTKDINQWISLVANSDVGTRTFEKKRKSSLYTWGVLVLYFSVREADTEIYLGAQIFIGGNISKQKEMKQDWEGKAFSGDDLTTSPSFKQGSSNIDN